MLNLNTVALAGYVGQDPTVNTYAGKNKMSLRLATTEIWYDDRGEKHEKTDWHEIVYWGKTAPQLAKMIRAGSGLVVRGKVRCDEYTHEGAKKWRNYIQAAEICLADKQQTYTAGPGDAYEGPEHYEEPRYEAPRQNARSAPSNNQQMPPRNDPRGRR